MAFTEITHSFALQEAIKNHKEFVAANPCVTTQYLSGGVSLYSSLFQRLGRELCLKCSLNPCVLEASRIVEGGKIAVKIPRQLEGLNKEEVQMYVSNHPKRLSFSAASYTGPFSVASYIGFHNRFGELRHPTKLGKWLRKHLIKEVSDEMIRLVVEDVKLRVIYVTFVNTNCSLHYRVMRQECNLSSCMSHSLSHYGIQTEAFIDASPEDRETFSSREKFHHPVDAYDNSPNSRLALFSFTNPLEVSKGYPFIGRSIYNMESGDFIKVYGDTSLSKNLPMGNCEGILLNRIQLKSGEQVLPYVDSDNSVSEVERGGKAYWLCHDDEEDATHKGDYQTGLAEKKKSLWCAHCEEYHDSEDEDEEIVLRDGSSVYGSCREEYSVPLGRDEYYINDDLYYSEYHCEMIHMDDTVTTVSDEYFHTDDIGDSIQPCYDGVYRESDDVVYSEPMGEWIPRCEAIKTSTDVWVLDDDLEEWEEEHGLPEDEEIEEEVE